MKIGAYELGSEVGRGGMGVVFRARGADGRDVAVKVLRRTDRSETVARFERERRLLVLLGEKAGFVPLLEAGDSPQGPYIVMPFLPGGTLRDRLEKGPLSVDETVALGRDLASALGRAHERGIVHRDLKPENVLFPEDGGQGKPLVADLGLAKHFVRDVPGASASVSLSHGPGARGTAGYMPFEQISDARRVGPPADVFALGAVLYECLAGAPAFAAESGIELLAKVEHGQPEPLRQLRPETPAWLARVIERAMARSPEARFRDGAALERALAAGRGAGRARRIGIVLVALALGLAGLVVVLSRKDNEREAAPLQAETRGPGAAELVSRATARFDRRDFAGAIEDGSRAIQLEPGNAAAWASRGAARLARKELDGAISDLSRAIDLDAKAARAWSDRSAARIAKKDLEGAIVDASRAIGLSPKLAAAWANRGTARFLERNVESAVPDFNRAVQLDPKDASLWAKRGAARRKTGDPGARSDFERALDAAEEAGTSQPEAQAALAEMDAEKAHAHEAPRDAAGFIYRAISHLKDDPEAALADFSRAIDLDPENIDAWEGRGFVRYSKGDLDGAITDSSRAIELYPKNIPAWTNRSLARRAKGDLDGAIADATRAIELDSRDSITWRNRAIARFLKNDHDGAIADSSRVVELDPRDGIAWANRGLSRVAKGDRDGARADLKRALKLGPNEAFAPRARAELERLEKE
ncbi:protein kinase [bacterium]|nr:protein kinase [bacterium]